MVQYNFTITLPSKDTLHRRSVSSIILFDTQETTADYLDIIITQLYVSCV